MCSQSFGSSGGAVGSYSTAVPLQLTSSMFPDVVMIRSLVTALSPERQTAAHCFRDYSGI